MIDIEKIKKQIVEALSPLNPEKIILFGSYAYGTPTEDSDIDLYIVTNDNFIPQTWRQKMNIKLTCSKAIKELKKKYDFDLIVHTQGMHKKFSEMDSLFSREILEKGNLLYG